jgi:hypothetical protein
MIDCSELMHYLCDVVGTSVDEGWDTMQAIIQASFSNNSAVKVYEVEDIDWLVERYNANHQFCEEYNKVIRQLDVDFLVNRGYYEYKTCSI